ncbi:MAG: hypothetical protein WBO24_20480 [Nitrospirales bacterium]
MEELPTRGQVTKLKLGAIAFDFFVNEFGVLSLVEKDVPIILMLALMKGKTLDMIAPFHQRIFANRIVPPKETNPLRTFA